MCGNCDIGLSNIFERCYWSLFIIERFEELHVFVRTWFQQAHFTIISAIIVMVVSYAEAHAPKQSSERQEQGSIHSKAYILQKH